jgi:hypothetical protein
MRSSAAARASLFAALALSQAGCSTLYDLDALDSATVDCGDLAVCRKVSTEPCSAVYVPPSARWAYVALPAGESGGVSRVDLGAQRPDRASAQVYGSHNGAAGIGSDGNTLLFAIPGGPGGPGGVFEGPITGQEEPTNFALTEKLSYDNPTGVGINALNKGQRFFVQDGPVQGKRVLVAVDKGQSPHVIATVSTGTELRAVAPLNEFTYAVGVDANGKGVVYRFMTDDIFASMADTTPAWSALPDVQSLYAMKAYPPDSSSQSRPHVFFSGKDGAWVVWQAGQGGAWPTVTTQLGALEGCATSETGGAITADIAPPEAQKNDLQVYWTYRGGCVLRSPIHGDPGKPPTVLTRNLKNPSGIAVVSGAIYVCTDEGLIRMTPK